MLDNFFDTICSVGIFVICAQSIVHFRPKGEYEKYLRLIVSIMVMIQLFIPLVNLVFKGEEISTTLRELEKQLKSGVETVGEKSATWDERLEEMTLEEVRKRVEEQAAEESAEQSMEANQATEEKRIIQVEPVRVE